MPVTIKGTLYVKPTKPTKHVQIPLSSFDTLTPPNYAGIMFFFKNSLKKNNFMNIQKLIASLEDLLNDYYFLAGTLKSEPDGRSIIDCNDRGVQFIIAECSDITINQLENNKWEHAVIPYGLVPSQPRANKIYPILLKVQHTTFADGSVVLGILIHHQISDGIGFYAFFNNWGRKARLEQIDPPINDRSLLKTCGNSPTLNEDLIIKKLKSEKAQNIQKYPDISSLTTKIFHFSQNNLKSRACPKMLVSQLINGSPSTIALQVRKANTDVNNSRVRTIIDLVEQQTDKSLIRPNMLFYEKSVMINNVSKLQKHYLLDFGDGTPIKLRLNREADLNDGISMILYDEDGVDVYICLLAEILENLENDPEFKKFIVPSACTRSKI
ncbi:transferase family-domain-containing protein [Gigaspora rosea]|uniref:Transferase family-domain-containing protein n=1 Tax=Gigaspora rosea TaxID=44941 RepID=A0A397UZR7_9GLOM|nr:transferase family-domain-containing protein [Gigaspora rosea]